jgi:hypothetical protein
MSHEKHMCLAADVLVWTKYGPDGVEVERGILARKEAERQKDSFWWGIGSSIAREKLRRALNDSDGTLHVLFSRQLMNKPKRCGTMKLWTKYWDWDGELREIPDHALVVSKDKPEDSKKIHQYWALVCKSQDKIATYNNFDFYEKSFQNYSGKAPYDGQNTLLLQRKLQGDHGKLRYKLGFGATLVSPYLVELDGARPLESWERDKVVDFEEGDDYKNDLIQPIRFRS